MKFCQECGSVLNNKDACDVCGYGKIGKSQISLQELLQKDFDLGDLTLLSYRTSGSMMGGYRGTTLDFSDGILEVVDQAFHDGPITIQKYQVSEEDLNHVKELVLKYNFPAWKDIPINTRFIAYDVPSTTFYLQYSNRFFSISCSIDMTDEERKIFFDFKDFVFSFIQEKNLISTEEKTGKFFYDIVHFKDKKNVISKKYCPECGNVLKEGQTICDCGTIIMKD